MTAMYNFLIVVFSKGFGPDLGNVDVLFEPVGCILIIVWGLAFFALAFRYKEAPSLALVFALEKAVYVGHHIRFVIDAETIGFSPADAISDDFLTGFFFSAYGIGDFLSLVFFCVVAYQWRHNLWGNSKKACRF